jgi:thiamine phosphate synthase YjbQ (UPF0047 family)
MKVVHEKIQVQSELYHPTFHDVTEQVKEIIKKSGMNDGMCLIYSQHTTCSVMTQESSHDKTFFGLEYLQQDLCDIMEGLIPTCRAEGQYMHPGPKHIDFAMGLGTEEGEWTSLNTDAHLRSVIFGRSETLPVIGGELQLGEFGYIYFVDWDQVRARKRTCQVMLTGE